VTPPTFPSARQPVYWGGGLRLPRTSAGEKPAGRKMDGRLARPSRSARDARAAVLAFSGLTLGEGSAQWFFKGRALPQLPLPLMETPVTSLRESRDVRY
jgi:hypothetical protein